MPFAETRLDRGLKVQRLGHNKMNNFLAKTFNVLNPCICFCKQRP